MIELYESISYERGFSEHGVYGNTLEGIVDGYKTRQFMDGSFKPKRHKRGGGWGMPRNKSPFGKTFVKPAIFDKGGHPPGYFKPKTGFGRNCGLGPGYVYGNFKVRKNEFSLKIRPDKPHKGYNFRHLNNTMHYHKGKRKPIINNNHIPFNWSKKKKW